MKIMLMTKSKKYTCKLLSELIKSHKVTAVVGKDDSILKGSEMEAICIEHGICILSNEEMYEMLDKGTLPECDLVISNTYGRLIKRELIDFVNGNCINLHGAVLPDYKGVMTYNFGILNGESQWGVSAHFVNEKFDEGDIIEISRFDINPDTITVKELEERTQKEAYELTLKLIENWKLNGRPSAVKQSQNGRYYSRQDFEMAKKINPDDSAESVKRKIRAFWFPPYEGAYIEIDKMRFELMPPRD